MEPWKAVVLAVGTEITDGQIIDRNSSWISERIVNDGVAVIEHRSVPDDRRLIRDALESYKRHKVNLIFVTGGLGPTTDDFTREVVAEAFSRSLEFDDNSWLEIQDKLRRRQAPISPSQRQQCLFPQGAEIFSNSVGTANGFYFSDNRIHVFTLPGPPIEIEAVWNAGLSKRLRELLPMVDREELFLWRCLGKGESEVADMTEAVMASTGLRLGYRAHAPYVEVKVWVKESEHGKFSAKLAELDRTLAPWVVNRQNEDLASDFVDKLSSLNSEVRVIDAATNGLILERFAGALKGKRKDAPEINLQIETRYKPPLNGRDWLMDLLSDNKNGAAVLAVTPENSSSQWWIGLKTPSEQRIEAIAPPYAYSLLTERARRFITEKLLQYFLQHT